MPEICVVGVYVRDLERAREFYCDTLGFEIAGEYGDCILQLKSEGVTFVVERIEGDFPARPCVAIGIRTDDLEKEMGRLSELGVMMLHDTPQPFPEGVFAACRDPEGNLLELLEFGGKILYAEHGADSTPGKPRIPGGRHIDRAPGAPAREDRSPSSPGSSR
jgi:catechol 2,3-dioxygenase-like lactoylglutathione lyase family enzyme